MCWAFGVVPSELNSLYWRVTLRDLRSKIRLRVGDETSRLTHQHHALLLAGHVLLGGGSSKKKAASQDKSDATQVQSFAHLTQILKKNL